MNRVFDLDCGYEWRSGGMVRMRTVPSLCQSPGFYALARSSAGQRRHIKPGKLHRGNKMAIK